MNNAPKPPYPKWIVRLISAGVIVFAVGFTAFAYWVTRPQPPRVEPSGASGIFAKNPDPARVALGKTIYDRQCASCHGANLEGQPDWQRRLPNGRMPAPPHDDSGHT